MLQTKIRKTENKEEPFQNVINKEKRFHAEYHFTEIRTACHFVNALKQSVFNTEYNKLMANTNIVIKKRFCHILIRVYRWSSLCTAFIGTPLRQSVKKQNKMHNLLNYDLQLTIFQDNS